MLAARCSVAGFIYKVVVCLFVHATYSKPTAGMYAVLCRYFWLNAGILVAGLIVYALVARTYTEKPVLQADKVPGRREGGSPCIVCMSPRREWAVSA